MKREQAKRLKELEKRPIASPDILMILASSSRMDWLDGAIYFASRSDTEALTYIKHMPKSVLAILRAAVEEHAKPSGRSTEGSLVSGSK